MKQKMIIYDTPAGPYPARVRIALAEKNMLSSVQFVRINLWKESTRSLNFLPRTIQAQCQCLNLMTGL